MSDLCIETRNKLVDSIQDSLALSKGGKVTKFSHLFSSLLNEIEIGLRKVEHIRKDCINKRRDWISSGHVWWICSVVLEYGRKVEIENFGSNMRVEVVGGKRVSSRRRKSLSTRPTSLHLATLKTR